MSRGKRRPPLPRRAKRELLILALVVILVVGLPLLVILWSLP